MKDARFFSAARVIVAVFIATLIGIGGCASSEESATTEQGPPAARADAAAAKTAGADKAPDFTLKDLDGKDHKLSDYRGKVVILDFWDTWCPPCREEIPGFVQLQKELGGKDLQIIGIALGREGKEKVKKFAADYKINYPTLIFDGNQKLLNDYGGIRSIPTTFIIDKEGGIVEKLVGFHPKNQFEKKVAPLL